MKITITEQLRDQLLKLDGDAFWERLADITEHPPEWLKEMAFEPSKVRYEVVKDGGEYGELRAFV